MKICSISVEPMPSTMRMPVASCQACATLAGSGSPAEMHACSDGSSTRSRRRARYMVGAVASRVTSCRRTVSTSGSIPGLAIGANEAPKRIGNSTSTPSPNVNAIGAVPVNTSSGEGERIFAREGVADREHVAVEVHAALRLAGRAGGEGDQGDVVARGRDRLEGARRGELVEGPQLAHAASAPRRPGARPPARARPAPWRSPSRARRRAASASSRPRSHPRAGRRTSSRSAAGR